MWRARCITWPGCPGRERRHHDRHGDQDAVHRPRLGWLITTPRTCSLRATARVPAVRVWSGCEANRAQCQTWSAGRGGLRPGVGGVAGDFEGLVVAVTGGGSGIGLATARLLAARGASVASLDLDPAPAASSALPVAADVTDDDSVRAAVATVAERFGALDVLVNNAGIGATGTVEDNSEDEWRRVLDVNLLGIVRASRAALPHLRRSSAPAIVNTCSIAAVAGLPRRALYSATKGAVLALTLAMAADHVGEGIRVNCVVPGTADTPWVRRLLEATPTRNGSWPPSGPASRPGAWSPPRRSPVPSPTWPARWPPPRSAPPWPSTAACRGCACRRTGGDERARAPGHPPPGWERAPDQPTGARHGTARQPVHRGAGARCRRHHRRRPGGRHHLRGHRSPLRPRRRRAPPRPQAGPGASGPVRPVDQGRPAGPPARGGRDGRPGGVHGHAGGQAGLGLLPRRGAAVAGGEPGPARPGPGRRGSGPRPRQPRTRGRRAGPPPRWPSSATRGWSGPSGPA